MTLIYMMRGYKSFDFYKNVGPFRHAGLYPASGILIDSDFRIPASAFATRHSAAWARPRFAGRTNHSATIKSRFAYKRKASTIPA
jgi:hypothetical protein